MGLRHELVVATRGPTSLLPHRHRQVFCLLTQNSILPLLLFLQRPDARMGVARRFHNIRRYAVVLAVNLEELANVLANILHFDPERPNLGEKKVRQNRPISSNRLQAFLKLPRAAIVWLMSILGI
jgi:hypothetical protein